MMLSKFGARFFVFFFSSLSKSEHISDVLSIGQIEIIDELHPHRSVGFGDALCSEFGGTCPPESKWRDPVE